MALEMTVGAQGWQMAQVGVEVSRFVRLGVMEDGGARNDRALGGRWRG